MVDGIGMGIVEDANPSEQWQREHLGPWEGQQERRGCRLAVTSINRRLRAANTQQKSIAGSTLGG